MLDDHIVTTQSMSFSPYKKPFEERIAKWEAQLSLASDILDEWIKVRTTVVPRASSRRCPLASAVVRKDCC